MLGSILASMLSSIYNCIYRPGNLASVFTEYDDAILSVFGSSSFGAVFIGVKMVGIGFLVVTCLVSLMDKVSAGDFSTNNLFKHLIKFFILYAVLLNILSIFMWLLKLSGAVADELSLIVDFSVVSASNGSELDQARLAESIDEYVGVVSSIGYLILALIPYIISLAYIIVLGFFASSRLIEVVIRVTLAPVVIGVSGLSSGGHTDAARFIKHTAGLLFQILVIVAISAAITFTRNAMVTSGYTMSDPVSVLVEEDTTREISIGSDGVWIPARDRTGTETVKTYTRESTYEFISTVLNTDEYVIGIGLMVSALFLIFKSKGISTRLFG